MTVRVRDTSCARPAEPIKNNLAFFPHPFPIFHEHYVDFSLRLFFPLLFFRSPRPRSGPNAESAFRGLRGLVLAARGMVLRAPGTERGMTAPNLVTVFKIVKS